MLKDLDGIRNFYLGVSKNIRQRVWPMTIEKVNGHFGGEGQKFAQIYNPPTVQQDNRTNLIIIIIKIETINMRRVYLSLSL